MSARTPQQIADEGLHYNRVEWTVLLTEWRDELRQECADAAILAAGKPRLQPGQLVRNKRTGGLHRWLKEWMESGEYEPVPVVIRDGVAYVEEAT